jgi:predicted alpha-1,6-mannanase (GH76 family)
MHVSVKEKGPVMRMVSRRSMRISSNTGSILAQAAHGGFIGWRTVDILINIEVNAPRVLFKTRMYGHRDNMALSAIGTDDATFHYLEQASLKRSLQR